MYDNVEFCDYPNPDNVTKIDHGALPMISDMHRYGIRIDVPHLNSMSKTLGGMLDDIEYESSTILGNYQDTTGKGTRSPFMITSPDHVSRLLFQYLKVQGDDLVPMTEKGARYATSDDVLSLFKKRHPIVPMILEHRGLSKLKGTYTDALPRLVDSDSRLHTTFNVTQAATGRLSSSNPNLQNIPVRSELGKLIRKAFIARPGYVLVSCDLSQIEMVWAAHRSQDPVMMEVFRLGQDLHTRTACIVYELDYAAIMALTTRVENKAATPEEVKAYKFFKQFQRLPCKTTGFGVLYGQTPEGMQASLLADGLEMSLELCQDFMDNKFFGVYKQLKVMLDKDYSFVKAYGMSCDAFGRVRLVPQGKSSLKWLVSEGTRQAGNHPEQCVNPSTHVFVKGEGLRRLGDLVGTKQIVWDGSKWAKGNVVKTTKRRQLRVKLYSGLELSCSPTHPILVRDPDGGESWKFAGELQDMNWRNSRVVFSEAINKDWSWNTFPPTCDIQEGDKNPPADLTWWEEDKELFGEMLGRIASDGGILCSSKSRSFSPKLTYMLVAEHEKELLPRLSEAAAMVTDKWRVCTDTKPGKTVITGEPYRPVYRIEIYNRGLAELLLQWQIKDRIPEFVWKDSRVLKAYLRGMFDGDGNVTPDNVMLSFGGGYRKIALAKDVQQALLLLGIRSRLRPYPKAIRLAVQKPDNSIFESQIGFMKQSKKDALAAIKPTTRNTEPSYGRATSIKSIEELEPIEMVDFVDSSTGRFCADGFVVHNSSAQATVKLAMAELTPIYRRLRDIFPLLQIHDQLIFEAPQAMAESWAGEVKEKLERATPLTIPTRASSDIGNSWLEL